MSGAGHRRCCAPCGDDGGGLDVLECSLDPTSTCSESNDPLENRTCVPWPQRIKINAPPSLSLQWLGHPDGGPACEGPSTFTNFQAFPSFPEPNIYSGDPILNRSQEIVIPCHGRALGFNSTDEGAGDFGWFKDQSNNTVRNAGPLINHAQNQFPTVANNLNLFSGVHPLNNNGTYIAPISHPSSPAPQPNIFDGFNYGFNTWRNYNKRYALLTPPDNQTVCAIANLCVGILQVRFGGPIKSFLFTSCKLSLRVRVPTITVSAWPWITACNVIGMNDTGEIDDLRDLIVNGSINWDSAFSFDGFYFGIWAAPESRFYNGGHGLGLLDGCIPTDSVDPDFVLMMQAGAPWNDPVNNQRLDFQVEPTNDDIITGTEDCGLTEDWLLYYYTPIDGPP